MELEGFRRSMAKFNAENISVSAIVTDRHPSIRKFIRDTYPDIQHYFDVWHIAKGKKYLIMVNK